MDPTAAHLAANEHRFREVNERLVADLQPVVGDEEPIAFVCECSATTCRETIELILPEYRALRGVEHHFAVVDGHEIPEIEMIVERRDRYSVVQKL